MVTTTNADLSQTADQPAGDRYTLLAAIIGLAIIAAFVVSNLVLSDVADSPEPDASAAEIADFFTTRTGQLQWVAGLRFVELFLVPFFAVGVARHVRGSGTDSRVLVIVALMAQVWLLAVGTVANTFESLLVFRADQLGNEPALAHGLFLAMTALFNVAVLPWALVIFCLSEAGRRTRTLPLWLCALGYLQAIFGLVGGVAIAQTLHRDNVADAAAFFAFLGFGLWIFLVSIHLLRSWRHVDASTSEVDILGSA